MNKDKATPSTSTKPTATSKIIEKFKPEIKSFLASSEEYEGLKLSIILNVSKGDKSDFTVVSTQNPEDGTQTALGHLNNLIMNVLSGEAAAIPDVMSFAFNGLSYEEKLELGKKVIALVEWLTVKNEDGEGTVH